MMDESLEYIFQPGDVVRSLPTGKIYTVEETVHEGMKVYLLPRKEFNERLYNYAHELILIQEENSNNSDIRKPESKPLIVKSGETWAAYWKGIDYLYVGIPGDFYFEFKPMPEVLNSYGNMYKSWKPFSDITLDDEIAKLRPVCKFYRDNMTWHNKLVYVDDNDYITANGSCYPNCRLATPNELNNLKEQI